MTVAALLVLPASLAAAAAQPFEAITWTALLSAAGLVAIISVPGREVETSLRTPVSVASAVVLDPSLVLLVNLLALVSGREFRDRPSPWMIAFNHLQLGLVSFLVATLAHQLPVNEVVGAFVIVPVYDAANIMAVTAGTWLLRRASPREALRQAAAPFPLFATNSVFIALLAVLLVVLYQQAGPWAAGLLIVPAWLGYAAMKSGKAANDRATELAARVSDLEVVHRLSKDFLGTRHPASIAGLARDALLELCEGVEPADVVVALDGRLPPGLTATDVPGTEAKVGLPPYPDERQAARVGAVCSALGLALQRLAVEEKLRASQQAEAALAAGILAEGTTARSVVALNVHDDVLPFLAAAQIQAENVMTAVERSNPEKATELATTVRDAVSDGIAALRGVLEDLRRQTIVPGDLLPRLRRAAEQARLEYGLAVFLDTERFDGNVSHPVEILLTETVTGLMANVVKHAQASHVTVRLRSRGQLVVLDVADDGVGFDPAAVGPGHQGLALMRQRVALARGYFHVVSRPGTGTTVRLRVNSGVDSPPPPALPGASAGQAQSGSRDPVSSRRL